jgi:translocation and assembly module TamB
MALRDVSLEARLIDNGFSFKGAARAGTGSIDAEGKLTWKDREPNGELRVKGQDLLLADVPEARVTASPDLRFRVAGRDLEATGTVIVPYARLVPADLAGAVLPSSDEVIVGSTPRDPNSTFRVTSNIKLVLGERVTIDALGLTGRLAGSITAQTLPDGTSRGSGELGVAEGKYAALGRRLDIERGRLIFSGGLLGDPGIDIRATKEFPDVKAGVNVRGTLREPRMTFFSEPSLPQSQIVSLILAGGTLESAQAASGGNAGRDALIAQGGAILAQQLGSRIGIEDVGIEQNLSNETSLVLGKYLSPRLYVSYGISFAEAINTLKMRYTINDRWTLRTEAGKEQSAEIVYTIERD